jgi:hypothetical protein
MLKNVLTLLLASVPMIPNSLFLLMRVPLIAGQHTEVKLGQ